jgi:hypothetical protein
MKTKPISQVVAATAFLALAGQASAVSYDLCTGVTTKTMPDGTVVTMWGYGMDAGAPCLPTVPGPQLTVPPGDSTLTVNLRNELAEPVSMVISGQQAVMTPVFFTDAQGRQRVRSFTHETSSGGTGVYTWSNLKPGTFLYSSGTHPAVQVQMGLYGAMTHDAAVGEAYTGVAYDNEVVLLYSEIDPALHAAVDGGSYGTTAYPSTVDYLPRYFLVNGAPYVAGDADLPAGSVGQHTLIRLLNAGLQDHAPVLQGQHLTLVAEDGNAYPWPRTQYDVLMAAGKTKDAIFTPSAEGSFAVYDRRLRSGLFTKLAVTAAAAGPLAVDDTVTVAEDTTASGILVLANDSPATDIDPSTVAIDAQPLNGLATANADGSVDYQPYANFNGSDGFSYTVRSLTGVISNAATVSVTVTPVNDNPVAADDAFSVAPDSANNLLDVLANDSDVDNDTLTVAALGTPSSGGTVTTDGSSISYSPLAGFLGDESFTYDISDGNGGAATATVTVTVAAADNQPPVANDDFATVTRNTGSTNNSVTIDLTANDTDADGTIDAASVAITSNPAKGAVVNNADGTVTYTPAPGKRGSDTFGYTVDDDLGATSNVATVRLNIVK